VYELSIFKGMLIFKPIYCAICGEKVKRGVVYGMKFVHKECMVKDINDKDNTSYVMGEENFHFDEDTGEMLK
jgi:hypothetical protein